MFFANLYALLQVFAVAIFAVKWIGIIVPFVLLICYFISSRASRAIRESNRLSNTSKSPMLSYFSESASGASTIRSFDRVDDFILHCHTLLDNNILAVQMSSGVEAWFCIRIDLVAIGLMFAITLLCVFCHKFTDPILLSLLLSYTMTIQFSLTWMMKCFVYVQTNMVNAARCMTILDVPQEEKTGREIQEEWPSRGEVEFKEV